MKIAIDTNIVLDMLAKREPFFKQSQAVIQLVAERKLEGAITANSVTDVYYILRKHLDSETAKTSLRGLTELLDIIDVTQEECLVALELPMSDYEDALLSCCARQWEADYIVTRNIKDFKNSPVKALTPNDFLKTVSS